MTFKIKLWIKCKFQKIFEEIFFKLTNSLENENKIYFLLILYLNFNNFIKIFLKINFISKFQFFLLYFIKYYRIHLFDFYF